MKKIFAIIFSLITGAVSLSILGIMQQQNVAAFNDNNGASSSAHGHVNCGTSGCQVNGAGTYNDGTTHSNYNFNSQSGNSHTNTFTKP